MKLLFVHGASGYDEDRGLAEALANELDATLTMPRMPGGALDYAAWSSVLEPHLSELDAGDAVVGHAFGASVVAGVLAHPPAESHYPRGIRVALLAMPDWSRDGWGAEEYVVTGPEPLQRMSLHHCRDDEVVPFAHLRATSRQLPSAQVYEYRSGGHEFDGQIAHIASTL